ncbi:MAG: hypothetical protein LBM02_08785 [Lachnospiraceae bacterium]|jgi:hypothetical protein|nr:hypothetical protein [Lachnospiraceae bacterium]
MNIKIFVLRIVVFISLLFGLSLTNMFGMVSNGKELKGEKDSAKYVVVNKEIRQGNQVDIDAEHEIRNAFANVEVDHLAACFVLLLIDIGLLIKVVSIQRHKRNLRKSKRHRRHRWII